MEDTQRYWFEEVPEERRYWFLAPYGPSASQEAEREDAEFPSHLESELENIQGEKTAKALGMSPEQYHESRRSSRDRLKKMEEVGFGPRALSDPWWPEAQKGEHGLGKEYLEAPKLFSTRDAAEEELRPSKITTQMLTWISRNGMERSALTRRTTTPLR